MVRSQAIDEPRARLAGLSPNGAALLAYIVEQKAKLFGHGPTPGYVPLTDADLQLGCSMSPRAVQAALEELEGQCVILFHTRLWVSSEANFIWVNYSAFADLERQTAKRLKALRANANDNRRKSKAKPRHEKSI